MTNADKFKNIFGLYATELWSMPGKDFLEWLNSEAMNCSEIPNNSDAISRQAAIEALADMHCKSDEDGYVWIIRSDAWARIDALPSAQPETHDKRAEMHACDLISRQAAIDAIRASTSKYTGFMEMEMYTDDDAVEAIEGLPSAQKAKGELADVNHYFLEGVQRAVDVVEGMPEPKEAENGSMPCPDARNSHDRTTDDCISRQAAIDALGERPMVWIGSDYELGARNQYDADVLAIETVPSAQPEIVRCKDCKHRYVEDMIWHCPFGLMGGENFFCGYGSLGTVERRRDG